MWKTVRINGKLLLINHLFVSDEMHGEVRKDDVVEIIEDYWYVYETGQDGRNIPDIASKICYEFVHG